MNFYWLKYINEFPLFIYLQLIIEEKEKMASQAKNTFEIPKWFVEIRVFLRLNF